MPQLQPLSPKSLCCNYDPTQRNKFKKKRWKNFESSLPFSRWTNWVPKRLVSRGAGTRVQVSGSQTSAFFCPWSSSPPSANLGQIRPLIALLNSRNLPFLTYTQPCCLRKLAILFFFQATPCSHPCKTMYLLLLSLFHLWGENAYHMTPQSRAVPVYKYSTLIAL